MKKKVNLNNICNKSGEKIKYCFECKKCIYKNISKRDRILVKKLQSDCDVQY